MTLHRWLALLALALAVAAAGTRWYVLTRHGGDDFDMICASARVIDAGGNPYDVRSLAAAGGPRLPLTFPPMVPRAMAPACGAFELPLIVLALGLVVVIAWRWMGADLLLSLCAAAAGFAAFPWIWLTGNPAMFEAVAIAAACASMMSSRAVPFGVAIGAAAFLKSLMPLALLPSALIKWRPRSSAAAAAAAILTVAVLHALDWIVDARAAAQYWTAYRIDFPRYGVEELRYATEHNPSMFAFLPIAAAYAGLPAWIGLAAAAAAAAMFVARWLRLLRSSGGSDLERTWLALLAVAVIVVIHPRFKPYSVFALTPILGLVLTRLEGSARAWAIALACLAPNVLLILVSSLPRLPALPAPVIFALQYSQWVVAALAVALALTPRVFAAMVKRT